MQDKHLLFIFRSSPYASTIAQEGLDALLAAAVFDQKVSALFLNDGVFQLKKQQDPSNNKNYEKMLKALPMYDITNVFAGTLALQQRGIQKNDCNIEISLLTDVEIIELIHSADHILSF